MEDLTAAKSKGLLLSLITAESERSHRLNRRHHRGQIESSLNKPDYGRIDSSRTLTHHGRIRKFIADEWKAFPRLNERLPNRSSPWLNRTGHCCRMEEMIVTKLKPLWLGLITVETQSLPRLNGRYCHDRIEGSPTWSHNGRIEEVAATKCKTSPLLSEDSPISLMTVESKRWLWLKGRCHCARIEHYQTWPNHGWIGKDVVAKEEISPRSSQRGCHPKWKTSPRPNRTLFNWSSS